MDDDEISRSGSRDATGDEHVLPRGPVAPERAAWTRNVWVIAGGVATALSLALMVFALQLQVAVPVITMVVVVVLYVALVVAAFSVRERRRRVVILTVLGAALVIATVVGGITVYLLEAVRYAPPGGS